MEPRSAYMARLEHWRTVASRSHREFISIGNWRLAVLIVAVVIGWLAFGRGAFSPWWLAAPAVAFFVLARVMDGVERSMEQARRAIAHFEHGLARMDDKWAGMGATGEAFRSADHVFADDLDLFGRGSLFELLCTARTTSGEQTLTRWLTAAASREEALARQESLRELSPRVDLREELALLGEDVRAGVHSEKLAAWGSESHVAFPAWAKPAALIVATANVAAVTGYFAADWPSATVFVALVIALLLAYVIRVPVRQALAKAHSSSRDLQILSLLLGRLERERFSAPRLAQLRLQLEVQGRPASHRIAQLARLIVWIDSSKNMFVATLAPFLMLEPQLAMAVERWRAANGPHIRAWIDAMGEIEALTSLAAYSFEHPQASFPQFSAQTGDGAVCFEAVALGHPLMSAKTCAVNDVRLDGDLRLLIVSGSNMSGKSTLLRAIGLNCVLAWAGAPVSAARLQISPLALGASLRTVDSLQEGRSRFYAEILRLRQIMDLTAGERPVLFLLDELLSGTNSHDRRIGAEAVVRGLLERGALGLITTHDLALAQIADALGGRATNCHFEDHLEDGKISFDYKLRSGVVERSNALELMRAVGLRV